MLYSSFPTAEITEKPIFNLSSFSKLPKKHEQLAWCPTFFLYIVKSKVTPIPQWIFLSISKNTCCSENDACAVNTAKSKQCIDNKWVQGYSTLLKNHFQLSIKSLLSNGRPLQSYELFIWNPLDKIVCPALEYELHPFDLKRTFLFCSINRITNPF